MSWIQKLYETYEKCAGKKIPGSEPLMPIAHTTQQAHVEIVIDDRGNFRRATLVQKEDTVIPATEKSAGRTSGEAAHPLCDKIQYCAGDYSHFKGTKGAYFEGYLKQLIGWCQSPYQHPKAQAILEYSKKRCTVSDLVNEGILVAANGVLVVNVKDGSNKGSPLDKEDISGIFRLLTPKKENGKSIQDQGDAFVRWRVESQGDLCTGTWEDPSLQKSWQDFDTTQRFRQGLCMVSGEQRVLAEQHPARIRHGGDKAKIISSNDTNGFTFRGRFLEPEQAADISFDVTQKAHNALRWLIGRKQAYRSGDQVFVSWAVSGQAIPDPWFNTCDLFNENKELDTRVLTVDEFDLGDVGQGFANRLKQALSGFRAHLIDSEDIVVLGLDSATPGRMAIVFYREIKGSDFLDRIESWHSRYAWIQNFGKSLKFTGAPAPRDIAETAYGRRLDDKLRKATIERVLPCIIDGIQTPRDLVDSCVRRASNRSGLEEWEWEKCLGIACSLFKGSHHEKGYQMTLEENRKSRDYLYGRLLAVADHLESRALYLSGESKNRSTTAARLMQRFADRPYSTWRTIELSLTPYKIRLRSSRGAFLWELDQLMDEISSFFPKEGNEAFTNDKPLSGEFLLAYHCQRRKLRTEKGEISENEVVEENQTK